MTQDIMTVAAPFTNKLQALIKAYLNPTRQNSLALKLLFGIPLQPEDIRAALKSPQPNPLKDWLKEIIFCHIRFLCNNQSIFLGQILLVRKKEEELIILLEEFNERKITHERAQVILKEINLQVLQTLYEESRQREETCYQILQQAKARDLEIWRRLIKDERLFEQLMKAVETHYRFLAEGERLVRKVEQELASNDLPAHIRAIKEDKVQAFKDHVRLSAPEQVVKYAPEIADDPERAVVYAKNTLVRDEILVKNLMNMKQQSSQNFFSKQDNIFEDLLFKLGAVYNKFREQHPDVLFPEEASLDSLFDLLIAYKRKQQDDLKHTIGLKVQNNIYALSKFPEFSEIVKCLDRWQTVHNGSPSLFCASNNTVKIQPESEVVKEAELNNIKASDVEEVQVSNVTVSKENSLLSLEDKISYQALIKLINNECSSGLDEEATFIIKQIASFAELAQDSTNVVDFKENNIQIVEKLNCLKERYPALLVLTELHETISKLPEIEIDECMDSKDNDNFSL